MPSKVAIIYLSFHSEPYIDDMVSALKKMTYPKAQVELIIVDNPHPQYGSSVRFLEENVLPLSGNALPHVTILPQATNGGFAGGNNVGIKWAVEHGFDYVFLHNDDGFVSADFLEPLVEAIEKDNTVGAAQSLLLLYPETNLINSSGNSFNYLGLGFCKNLRIKKDSIKLPAVAETAYASGAAILLRADLLKQLGSWDTDYFLYHEDTEYSFRLRASGYKIVVVRDSEFFHKYTFGRSKEKFYYIERNRVGLMLTFFKWPTLFLILPMAIALEFGLLFFAGTGGWLKEKCAVYRYWLKLKNIKLWYGKRLKIQKMRKVKDAEMIKNFVGKVVFDEKSVDNPLLKYIGNPCMEIYWQIIKRLIVW